MRAVLVVGGAPRVAVDAVRYLTVRATGETAAALAERLRVRGCAADLLLSADARAADGARRFADRDGLEAGLGEWIAAHPEGVVVLSAAINDYEVAAVERRLGASVESYGPGEKAPSGGDELVIRLRPAAKVVDQLRPRYGLRGPIVAFKYEAADTVEDAARRLRERVGAALVVANSIDGGVQSIVDVRGAERFADREALLARLVERVAGLAGP